MMSASDVPGSSGHLPVRRKVFAYVTDSRRRLLLFRHADFPEAGVQVPAGSVQSGEALDSAVLREAREETGLADLTVACFLGGQVRDMTDFGRCEIHDRAFFHLTLRGDALEEWTHEEMDPADGGSPIRFVFLWAQLPDGVPALIADHDALLPVLIERLA